MWPAPVLVNRAWSPLTATPPPCNGSPPKSLASGQYPSFLPATLLPGKRLECSTFARFIPSLSLITFFLFYFLIPLVRPRDAQRRRTLCSINCHLHLHCTAPQPPRLLQRAADIFFLASPRPLFVTRRRLWLLPSTISLLLLVPLDRRPFFLVLASLLFETNTLPGATYTQARHHQPPSIHLTTASCYPHAHYEDLAKTNLVAEETKEGLPI